MKKQTASIEKKILIRSVSMPVAECTSMEWRDFMRLLHTCWQQSTSLANWASQTLARLDVSRLPGMKELPPLAAVDLYALAFGRAKPGKSRPAKPGGKSKPEKVLPVVEPQYDGGEFWSGGKIAAASLRRMVDRKYRKERGKIIWRRERRTPEYLYPVPFPVHNSAWTVWFDDSKNRGSPVVSLALPGGRVSLRLRNGPEFVRAVKVLKQIEDGELKQMEQKICRQASHSHYREGSQNGQSYRVMLRISYAMEVPDCPPEAIATIKTGSDPFVTLIVDGQEQLLWHWPHVKRWIDNHERFRQRFADDTKFEKRWPAKKKKRMLRRLEGACEKHHRRMKSAIQELACQVVNAAARRRVGRLHLDDSDTSFAEKFPWFQLRQTIQNKCDEFGMILVASGDTVKLSEEAILT